MKKTKPVLNKRIFWDIDFASINYSKDNRFVIERVFDRGDVEDIRQVRRYYGDEKILEVLTAAKYLFEDTVNFCSAIFDIPKEKFRCYILKQSRSQHSIY
ncbi:MAG: hypothetical protein ABIO55_12405 [Ginsengibacter sp.]